jgi:hypothetical protein
MAFATDSPNRPIIPRLESQGKRGSRPYTHPNCKCKWVRPFSDAGIKNFDEIGMKDKDTVNSILTSNETYESVTASLYDYAHKKYGKKFDRLPKSRKHYILMQELMRKLKTDEALDPTSLPIASMLKMTYDAIQPTLALRLAKMTHKHTNEVRDLIDDMVGESLSSERKHDIVLEHNLDFTFENLLELTTLALFEAYSDEHDVWDEEKNKLVDPSLLEDKEESKEGWTVPNSWDQSAPDEDEMQELERVESMDIEDGDLVDFGGYGRLYVLNVNYGSGWGGRNVDFWVTEDEEDRFDSNANGNSINPTNAVRVIEKGSSIDMEDFRNQFSDDSFESKATEDMIYDENGVWQPKPEERMFTNGSIMALQSHFEELEGYKSHEGGVTLCKICNNLFDTYSKFSDHYQTHSKKEQGMERDHSKPYTDKFGKRHVSWTCPKCGEEFGIAGHSGEGERFEHLMSHESKASEWSMMSDKDRWDSLSEYDKEQWGELFWEKRMGHTVRDDNDSDEQSHYGTAVRYWDYEALSDNEKQWFGSESKATEGGRGSGRKGHQKWMLGAEADPEQCPHCMIFTEKKNGNCQICGNSY